MRYIGGVVTVVAIVFPLVILYKLWNTKRESNINQQGSSSHDVTSYVIFDSEDFGNSNSNDNNNNNVIRQADSSFVISNVSDSKGSENINITHETNPTYPFGTSSSMLDLEDSRNNIHITITQQPPNTSPSIENSNNENNNNITPQLDSTIDLETPSVMSQSVDSTNSLSLPSVEYEVFLSFRGLDTRSQITEILYRFLVHSKIHTFKDDDEMRKGEGIWPTLVKAINQSKVYVPILSENYAHSKWCLNELAEIVECWTRDNRHIILPIFYMVDPRDVRHQSGPYQEAFEQHEKRFDPSTIQTWKNALKKIGDLKGWHVKNNNEQVAISDNVSEVIWSHISKSNDLLDNTVEFIGIDDHVQAVIDNLSLDSDEGMVMVGIHGSGGIGKTTLATAVYNKISTRFDRCCFLENIRETQQNKDGILILQRKLISSVLRKDFSEINDAKEGRKIIRERVSQFKVLVVLDDVDNTFKFDDIFGNAGNFISGSRFIATSRDIKVLRSLNEDQCRLYEVTFLDHDRSLQLFCKHAFRKDSPPPEFDALSRDIVSTTGGLPLTLKVVGSLLYREELDIWKEKLAQLKETTEKEVIETLKISYNALEPDARQIFLDIACFYIGSEKEIVSYMWEDCNFRPATNIKILIQRSMIKIDENNKFQMHDHLRDMGRDIVRNENIDFPWKRSRLWTEEDIKEMLRDKKGTNQVKAIRLNHSFAIECVIKSESFMNMLGIRYLEASNLQLYGDFNNLLPNLRWLAYHYDYSFKLKNLCMKNLVILDLGNSFGQCDSTEGWWDGLRHIELKGGTIGTVSRLRELDVSRSCENLEEVLVDVEKLTCLKILRTNGHIESNKKALVGRILPTSLKELSTSSPVPNLSEMLELETLTVEHCHDGFGLVPSNNEDDKWWKRSKLTFLRFEHTKIVHLPLSAKLLSLHICKCEVSEFLPNLAYLENLTELHIEGCHNLREIHGLGGLKSLITLYISGSKCLTHLDIDDLFSLNKVRELTISKCPLLTSVITCNGTSTSTSTNDQPAKVVDSLERLEISYPNLLPYLTKFPRLNNLELGDSIGDCQVLTLPACLEELVTLTLYYMTSTQVIKFSSKLRKLTYLTISYLRGLREIEGLSECRSLKRIELSHCESLEKFQVSGLDKLEELSIIQAKELKRLPSLQNLPKLRGLSLSNLTSLREIGKNIADLKCLEYLDLFGCESLERLPIDQLCGLEKLEDLTIEECTKLSVRDILAIKRRLRPN
ncbi:Disease resistance protein L6, partial [Linum perenne]